MIIISASLHCRDHTIGVGRKQLLMQSGGKKWRVLLRCCGDQMREHHIAASARVRSTLCCQ